MVRIMKKRFAYVIPAAAAMVIALAPLRLHSQALDFSGMLAAWASGHIAEPVDPALGLRYVPGLKLERSLGRGSSLSFDVTLNMFGTVAFPSGEDAQTDARAKFYRGWVRFATPRFEARFGLQKINFGSASLLRPLMWFDRIDPRDPLQITDGVSGLLLKYTFQNNTNIWLWGLYGNDEAKGWESYPTEKKAPEFGGRLQLPVPKGEVGFSYHHRRMDPGAGAAAIPGASPVPENRIAFDGKWDLGIGIWVEGALIKADSSALPLPVQRTLTLGVDYTFGIGRGLHVLAEQFFLQNSRTAFGAGQGSKLSALSLNYPLGILDTLAGIFYYDWVNNKFYRFLSLQRTYDHWSLYVIGFWNPESFGIYANGSRESSFGGKGIQIMVVFNH
jgi:hypothetical protein